MLCQDLADYDEDLDVRAAAKAVLATDDPAKIKDFLDNGLPVYRKAGEQRKRDQAAHNRYQVEQWVETGSPTVQAQAKAVLAGNDDAKIAQFVSTGELMAETADKQDAQNATEKANTIRARVEQIVASGGYEVQSLGQAALDSDDPAVIEEFYTTGYKAASQHDADTQKEITDALAARTKAVNDLTDLAQRATQAAEAQKKIINESVTATKALTDASGSLGVANKGAKQADAVYAEDLGIRKNGGPTRTGQLSTLRAQTCQAAGWTADKAKQVSAHTGVATEQARVLQDTGLSHGIAWVDVMQAQADAGAAASQAAETACHAAEATEAASRALDADRNATVDANNAVKYRQAAEREQAAAEKLADRAEKLAAAAQAAAADARTQRQRAEKDAADAQQHADNAAADYEAARRQRGIAREATARAISQSVNAYQAAGRAIDQQNIVVAKGGEAKRKQEDALAAGARFADKAQRAKTLVDKARTDDQNTSSKEFAAQAAEARQLAAETNCKHPDSPSGNGCPGTADMQKLRDDAARLRTLAGEAKTASDRSKNAANAASADAGASAAEARQAAAAAAAAAADARAAGVQAAKARQDATDARTAAATAIKDASKANADARASVQAARASINRAVAARTDADLTAKSAQDAVRQSAIASFWSRVSGRAALDARTSAAGIADPAASAIDIASAYADSDNDAAMAIDIANNAMQIGDAQAAAAQKHADDAAAAAVHAQEMADKAVAQVKPAYVAAQKAAAAATRAVKASNVAIHAAQDAANDANGAVDAADDAADGAMQAGQWADGAEEMAAQAGNDAGSAQQAANNASGYATKAQKAATNAGNLSGKITTVSNNITSLSNSMWGIAQGMSKMANDLKNAAWAKYGAEQQAAENKVNSWIDEQANWINDHFYFGSKIGKGITDSAAGTVKGLLVTSSCVGGWFLGTDSAAGDEWSVPDVTYLPKSDPSCNALVDGVKKLMQDPKQLLHWDDWKSKGWQYTLGEVVFDVATIGGTDGIGILGKLAKVGAGQVTKDLVKDIAAMSAKDIMAAVTKFGTEKMVNAIKELGTVNAARLVELADKLGSKVTFAADELTALSKAIRAKGIDAVEDTLRDLKDTPVVKGLTDLAERCFTPNSFTADTPVLLADGSTRRIADVAIGDRVRAADPITHTSKAESVTELHRTIDTKFADVVIRRQYGGIAIIHTTRDHLFWDQENRRWTEAGRLKPGTLLLGSRETDRVKVIAVTTFAGYRTMYDLTVDELHTFYVSAGRTAVLVHNEKIAPVPQVDSEYLQKIVNALYHSLDLPPGAKIYGDGSAMNSASLEVNGHPPIYDRDHIGSTRQWRSALNTYLTKERVKRKSKYIYFTRTERDIEVAKSLIEAIDDAQRGAYKGFEAYKGLGGC
ncbi:polymorphic toxin-type HINT domain-containing protein [Krasilnikovia sp. MM14-A1259]|uniref:polymorphic toxin-type HINT domain-containing protein n=1 Tax=Krasilnikovia sp. MM14-A1259 TaxID=3373539 RepID=UPI00399D4E08